MKKIAAFIMVLALTVSLCSCSVRKEVPVSQVTSMPAETTSAKTSSTPTEPETVTVVKKKKAVKKNKTQTADVKAKRINSVLVTDKYALEMYYHDDGNAESFAEIINKTAAAMPEGVKFYTMLVPTSIEFYGTEEYRKGPRSQRDSIKKVYSLLNDSVEAVDAYSYLADSTDSYIYFRSDHHWTARGAYCGYKAFCEASDNKPAALKKFPVHKIKDFLGTLYDATGADVLKNNPDYVECFEPVVDAENVIYSSSMMNDPQPSYVVAKNVNGSNKYLAFIAGDQPLEKITTDVENGKKIIVLKDSFGNALVPFLCNNYEEIYVADPRHIEFSLSEFVEENGIGEVLTVNYTFCMGNSAYKSAMDKLT